MNHRHRFHLRGDLSDCHRFGRAEYQLHLVLRQLPDTPWLLPWRVRLRFVLLLRCLFGRLEGYTFLYFVSLIVSRGLAISSTGNCNLKSYCHS